MVAKQQTGTSLVAEDQPAAQLITSQYASVCIATHSCSFSARVFLTESFPPWRRGSLPAYSAPSPVHPAIHITSPSSCAASARPTPPRCDPSPLARRSRHAHSRTHTTRPCSPLNTRATQPVPCHMHRPSNSDTPGHMCASQALQQTQRKRTQP